MSKPKIYLFVNSINGMGHCGMALSEDGHVLAGHASSNESWAKHDMGLTGTWKHEHYKAHYPDGYELEWVDDPPTHRGFLEANELLPTTKGDK